ncbi:hypothetical protein [uncultured Mediterranean phage uvDeep1-CGR2-KM23-C896]|nr:hypothetical protein [uncultured Mediterranean phage uvDeep1-CGR2-KM23-C896]
MVYLDKDACYEDTLLCLQTHTTTLTDVVIILQHYEEQEEYECCSGILKAINEYKSSLRVLECRD